MINLSSSPNTIQYILAYKYNNISIVGGCEVCGEPAWRSDGFFSQVLSLPYVFGNVVVSFWPVIYREGEVEFSVALQQLNATLTQLEAAVRSCDRISSLGTAVGLSAVEADTPNEFVC